jgi:hypothetical protein
LRHDRFAAARYALFAAAITLMPPRRCPAHAAHAHFRHYFDAFATIIARFSPATPRRHFSFCFSFFPLSLSYVHVFFIFAADAFISIRHYYDTLFVIAAYHFHHTRCQRRDADIFAMN